MQRNRHNGAWHVQARHKVWFLFISKDVQYTHSNYSTSTDKSHKPAFQRVSIYQTVYVRDRYTCTSPETQLRDDASFSFWQNQVNGHDPSLLYCWSTHVAKVQSSRLCACVVTLGCSCVNPEFGFAFRLHS